MGYEFERKLSDKADKWELHNLQTENRNLRNELQQLERKIGDLQAAQSNNINLFERLIEILLESSENNPEIANRIADLRQNIY